MVEAAPGDAFPLLAVPPPPVDTVAAAALLADRWGVTGALLELGSQQDRALHVDADGRRLVLRLDHPATPRVELEAQDVALRRLGDALAGDPEVPVPVPDRDGATIVDLPGGQGTARLLTWVEGRPLADLARVPAALMRDVGATVARVTAALEGLDHPGVDRVVQWDVARTPALVDAVADLLDPATTARVRAALDAGAPDVEERAAMLPRAVCHGDLHPDNVLVRRGPDGLMRITGVIDLGDVVGTWRVAELAVAVAGLVARTPARALEVVRCVVEGHVGAGGTPTVDELAVLWPLVRWRLAMEAAAAAQQVAIDPANDYAREQGPRLATALDVAASVPAPLAHAVARVAAGERSPVHPPPRLVRSSVGAWVPDLAPGGVTPPVRVLDLSTTSTVLVDGTWRDAEGVVATIEGAVAGTGAVAVGRWGEGRLTATTRPGPDEPATVHLGVDVVAPAGSRVTTAVAGTVRGVGARHLVLEADDGYDLMLAGIAPAVDVGAHVRVGDRVATVAPAQPHDRLPAHLHLGVGVVPGLAVPKVVPGSLADAWRTLCPDPSTLVGVAAAAPDDDPDGLARRRDAVLARAQERYYDRPPRIERGLGAWLIDTRGRAHLDVVNNVAAVGHSHPRVTAAVSRQLGLLNTNSRFLHSPMVELAERLVALLPDPLDTVFLVNSGSEAVEVALRLARVATGRRDVVCLAGAYHGWTTATDEITTPVLGRAKPIEPWVHPLEAPYLHRGPYAAHAMEGDASARAAALTAAAVARVRSLAAAGTPPAAFVAEAFLGNAGGIALPPGYLAAVYDAVRATGGLCVADEVQVGYGRTGSTFWAFEHEGVVPDVVTVAKMVGNGVPVAATVTTRAVADAYAAHDAFFSSSGGSPLGCAAALAVLDVIEDEGLVANARRVGERLRAGLLALAADHDVIGAVHGRGLYQGLDLVLDRATMTPAPAVARRVCERLLELGVVCQPTGEDGNVLKVKPPLVIDAAEADGFLAALATVLDEGW